MKLNEAIASRSQNEIEDAMGAFSDADWVRLKRTAQRYAISPLEPDDLIQEALVRALSGKRKCPANVDVVRFLAEAMRSISHGERNTTSAQIREVSINEGEISEGLQDQSITAERRMISHEEYTEITTKVTGLFEDDEAAQLLVEGMMEGMEGQELRELTELEETAFNSKRKLVRRRINAAFPDGWML
jgi:RNA polymerase sigma-70 factor (ECF subfamily)